MVVNFGFAEISFVIISNKDEFVKQILRIFSVFFGKNMPGVICLKILKKIALFLLGGGGYIVLELLWRGRSHGSMFLAGGTCFLLLGKLNAVKPRLPMALRCLVGAGVITTVELAVGLLANRDYRVWDYRRLPLNFHGQICLRYSLLWIPVSCAALLLYDMLDKKLSRKRPWRRTIAGRWNS